MTDANADVTELLPGQHTDLYPHGTNAVAFYELYDASGTLLESMETGPFDVSFTQPGTHTVYVYGVSQMGAYTPKPIAVEFTVKEGGEAGIIGVEIADEEISAITVCGLLIVSSIIEYGLSLNLSLGD